MYISVDTQNTCNGITQYANCRPPLDVLVQSQAVVEACFRELEELAANRYHHLVEFKQFHQFDRECDEVEAWIMERLAVTSNEELGKDLEHVEVRLCTPPNCIFVRFKDPSAQLHKITLKEPCK